MILFSTPGTLTLFTGLVHAFTGGGGATLEFVVLTPDFCPKTALLTVAEPELQGKAELDDEETLTGGSGLDDSTEETLERGTREVSGTSVLESSNTDSMHLTATSFPSSLSRATVSAAHTFSSSLTSHSISCATSVTAPLALSRPPLWHWATGSVNSISLDCPCPWFGTLGACCPEAGVPSWSTVVSSDGEGCWEVVGREGKSSCE
ncbi:hypothetical protein XENTR_v10017525 [Xenopus tropicalis]|nr:hypothetical protein XENTR_v10017525 [Xenopus tropicalis]